MTRANKKRVLFVCIGNACRSQMAEAFARTLGSDVMIPASAENTLGIESGDAEVRSPSCARIGKLKRALPQSCRRPEPCPRN